MVLSRFYALFLFTLSFLALSSCGNKENVTEFDAKYTATDFAAANQPEIQSFLIGFSSGGNFQTKGGIRVLFPAPSAGQTSLFVKNDGTPYVQGLVEIRVKEFPSVSSWILAGKSIASSDNPLFSLGNISITAFGANNTPLKMVAGKNYTISFPSLGFTSALKPFSYKTTDTHIWDWVENSNASLAQPTTANPTYQLIGNYLGGVMAGDFVTTQPAQTATLRVTFASELDINNCKMFLCYKAYPSVMELKVKEGAWLLENAPAAPAVLVGYSFSGGQMYYTFQEIDAANFYVTVSMQKTTSADFLTKIKTLDR